MERELRRRESLLSRSQLCFFLAVWISVSTGTHPSPVLQHSHCHQLIITSSSLHPGSLKIVLLIRAASPAGSPCAILAPVANGCPRSILSSPGLCFTRCPAQDSLARCERTLSCLGAPRRSNFPSSRKELQCCWFLQMRNHILVSRLNPGRRAPEG